VAVNCSTDAIVPAWLHLSYNPTALLCQKVNGNIDDLNAALYEELLAKIHQPNKAIIRLFANRYLCVPMFIAQNLQPFARSIMYGEACSAVPLYKAKK
jgi:hypothetical protein